MNPYFPRKWTGRLVLRVCACSPGAFRIYLIYRRINALWPLRMIDKAFTLIWSLIIGLVFGVVLALRSMLHALQAGLFSLGFIACGFYALLAGMSRSPLGDKMDVILWLGLGLMAGAITLLLLFEIGAQLLARHLGYDLAPDARSRS